MGAPKSSSSVMSSSSPSWRLGDNEQLMAWVKDQASELSKPREFSARDSVAKDLRVLFIALMPYDFARFKKEVVQLLSDFSGFKTDTIQSFKTRMIFAKLKMTEMDAEVLDQICEYLGVNPEPQKVEQIDKLVNLLSHPENLNLDEEKLDLLLYLSRVENVKIPGSRRHLSLLKYPPRCRTSSASNNPDRSLPAAEHLSENDVHDRESAQSNEVGDEDHSNRRQKKSKRRRRNHEEHDSNDQDNTLKKSKDSDGDEENPSLNDDNFNVKEKLELEPNSRSEIKTKKQLRKAIRSFLEKADVDVTMRMIKEHLLEHFGKDVLQSHKAFIKNTVMEIIERL